MKHRMIVYTGPMFSGKSDRLLKHVQELEDLTGTRALLYKPISDTRTGPEIRSRTGRSRPAYTLEDPKQLVTLANVQKEMEVSKTLVVGIDEAQFLTYPMAYNIVEVYRDNPRIMFLIAGLNTDSFGNPWTAMNLFFSVATQVVVIPGKCRVCGEDARATWRHPKASKQRQIVGDEDIYEPRCYAHWAEA